jgi:hypothetical protein
LAASGQITQQNAVTKTLTEMLTSSFNYVQPNGYLGNDTSLYADTWRNKNQLVFGGNMYGPRTYEPTHGLTPLPDRFAAAMPSHTIRKFLNKRKRTMKSIVDAMESVMQPQPVYQDDIRATQSALNLPHPNSSIVQPVVDTSTRLTATFNPAGMFIKPAFKDTENATWNTPMSRTFRYPKKQKLTESEIREYSTHYNWF